MSINLQKGQKIVLVKEEDDLSDIAVGLGWDENKGIRNLFNTSNIDCDATAFLLRNDKLDSSSGTSDEVSYRRGYAEKRCVEHSGDNLTGEGEGDDETIAVHLKKVPKDVNRIVFVVNIYSAIQRKQDFGMIKNAYIRVYNMKNGEELCRYNLSDNYRGKIALICGELYRNEKTWKFNAIGEGTNDDSIQMLRKRYE